MNHSSVSELCKLWPDDLTGLFVQSKPKKILMQQTSSEESEEERGRKTERNQSLTQRGKSLSVWSNRVYTHFLKLTLLKLMKAFGLFSSLPLHKSPCNLNSTKRCVGEVVVRSKTLTLTQCCSCWPTVGGLEFF